MVVQFITFTAVKAYYHLPVWLVDLLNLWLKVITFMVSATFMVNSYYIYGWYYISVFLTFMGDTRAICALNSCRESCLQLYAPMGQDEQQRRQRQQSGELSKLR